jgi:ferrous iron transport protein B
VFQSYLYKLQNASVSSPPSSAEHGGSFPNSPGKPIHFPAAFVQAVDQLQLTLPYRNEQPALPRFLIERLLIDAEGSIEHELTRQLGGAVQEQAHAARERLTATSAAPQQIEVDARYRWIAQVVDATVYQPLVVSRTWNDRIDYVVTHPVWGLGIFLIAMAITFQALFSWAVPVMDGISALFKALGAWIGGHLSEGPLQSLIVDGVVGGVGAVIVFVPQIALLFGLIAILEDSGYMARAAFLMDRLMSKVGLHGKSFIPMLSSFACAIPGIMSTRSIDNRRDRIATILIAPLMSCSARLPVYVLFIAAFIPAQTVWASLAYRASHFCDVFGWADFCPDRFSIETLGLKGESVPFLLELPPFQIPAWRWCCFVCTTGVGPSSSARAPLFSPPRFWSGRYPTIQITHASPKNSTRGAPRHQQKKLKN